MSKKGNIFNIQRYTIHDGPGIRTEVFMKGCPLSCRWCGNPESQTVSVQPGVYTSRCIGEDKCGLCKEVCDAGALIFTDGRLTAVKRALCMNCMKCADSCPADAIKQWGEQISVEEVMEAVRRDAKYYESSGGGVTVSGGEPLVQVDFVAEIFARCREERIHTCLESTFCAEWRVIEKAVEDADMLITDIKHMDSAVHKEHTGVSNELILENLKKLVSLGKPVIVRIPVIPGFNDDMQNMEATADFIINELGNGVQQLQLLSFMRLGEEKYASLGIKYPMTDVDVDRENFNEKIKGFAEYFTSRGINCLVGTKEK